MQKNWYIGVVVKKKKRWVFIIRGLQPPHYLRFTVAQHTAVRSRPHRKVPEVGENPTPEMRTVPRFGKKVNTRNEDYSGVGFIIPFIARTVHVENLDSGDDQPSRNMCRIWVMSLSKAQSPTRKKKDKVTRFHISVILNWFLFTPLSPRAQRVS
jgi:hypothetical protein